MNINSTVYTIVLYLFMDFLANLILLIEHEGEPDGFSKVFKTKFKILSKMHLFLCFIIIFLFSFPLPILGLYKHLLASFGTRSCTGGALRIWRTFQTTDITPGGSLADL
jgi:hypothetical protein